MALLKNATTGLHTSFILRALQFLGLAELGGLGIVIGCGGPANLFQSTVDAFVHRRVSNGQEKKKKPDWLRKARQAIDTSADALKDSRCHLCVAQPISHR
jgi:hypothetical protein